MQECADVLGEALQSLDDSRTQQGCFRELEITLPATGNITNKNHNHNNHGIVGCLT